MIKRTHVEILADIAHQVYLSYKSRSRLGFWQVKATQPQALRLWFPKSRLIP